MHWAFGHLRQLIYNSHDCSNSYCQGENHVLLCLQCLRLFYHCIRSLCDLQSSVGLWYLSTIKLCRRLCWNRSRCKSKLLRCRSIPSPSSPLLVYKMTIWRNCLTSVTRSWGLKEGTSWNAENTVAQSVKYHLHAAYVINCYGDPTEIQLPRSSSQKLFLAMSYCSFSALPLPHHHHQQL